MSSTVGDDTSACLGAKAIVAGHRRPVASDDDLPTILDGTRAYIRDCRDAVAASSSAEEVVEVMPAFDLAPQLRSGPRRFTA
jgi:hypothetical protein